MRRSPDSHFETNEAWAPNFAAASFCVSPAACRAERNATSNRWYRLEWRDFFIVAATSLLQQASEPPRISQIGNFLFREIAEHFLTREEQHDQWTWAGSETEEGCRTGHEAQAEHEAGIGQIVATSNNTQGGQGIWRSPRLLIDGEDLPRSLVVVAERIA